MTGEKRGAVHDYILQFKELSTRLGPELSSKWALSARHTGLLLQGAEASKHVTGPIFAVYETKNHDGDKELGLTNSA